MVAIQKRKWTVEEYLAMENASEEKHEFLDGEVRLMSDAGLNLKSGIGLNHNLIVGNAFASLHA